MAQELDITTREGFAAAAAPLERLLLSVSYGVLRSWDLAADAAQSALLKGWRSRHRVKDTASFKAWLVKIVINESKNMMRRGFTVELDENTPDEPMDRDMRIDVRRAVFELPENIIPVMMFAMGYPSEKPKPNAWHFKRMPLEDFVTEL